MLQLRKHNIFTRVEEGDHHSLGFNVGPHPATNRFFKNWKLKFKNALKRSIVTIL
jgi:predicted choloylglycine hydrolase